MLTPEELDLLPRNVSALYAELEEEIISDMARRIVKTDMATDTALWQIKRLEAIGGCQENIFDRLSKKTNKGKQELKKMFNEAVTKTYGSEAEVYKEAGQAPVPLKENKQLQRIINAGLRKTSNLFDNLTRTTAKTATGQFERVLDTAYMQITSGAFDYNTAIRGAIKELAKGIESIRYPSGHTDKLDVAVRRASLTGVSQTCGRMSEAIADEMDCDLVLVSAHFGARPEHAVWQGKVFSRSGDSEKYPDFIKSTGYGTGAGLKGWNCRHDFGAYIDGVSINPYSSERLKEMKNRTVEYDGEVMSEYDASQKQRAMERSIRKTKRELAGYDGAIKASDNPSLKEALQVDFDRKSVLLKRQEAKLKDFTDKTILRRDRAREQVPAHFDTKLNKTVAFNKSVSQKAVWANKKALKSDAERDIIKEQIRQDILSEKYPLSLNIGNQNKHILTSHSYKNEGSKSYIFGDLNTAQELVYKYHGTGEIRLNSKNQWIKKEFVTVDYDVGMIVDRETRKETATNRFSIHYSNSKGTHIVPAERKSQK